MSKPFSLTFYFGGGGCPIIPVPKPGAALVMRDENFIFESVIGGIYFLVIGKDWGGDGGVL